MTTPDNPMTAYTEGAGMARNLAHRCRREGDVPEFRRHMKRALGYLLTAKIIRDIRTRSENERAA